MVGIQSKITKLAKEEQNYTQSMVKLMYWKQTKGGNSQCVTMDFSEATTVLG